MTPDSSKSSSSLILVLQWDFLFDLQEQIAIKICIENETNIQR